MEFAMQGSGLRAQGSIQIPSVGRVLPAPGDQSIVSLKLSGDGVAPTYVRRDNLLCSISVDSR